MSGFSNAKGFKNVKPNNSLKVILLMLCFGGFCWLSFKLIDKYTHIQQFKQANNLLNLKQYSLAIDAYDKLLPTMIGQKHPIWVNRGYAFMGLNQYQDMLDSCSTAILIEPKADLGWNCQGEAMYHLKQYQKALIAFDQATALNGKEATFWLNKSRVLFQLQEYEKAIGASEKAIALTKEYQSQNSTAEPNLAIAFNQKGHSLLKLNQYSPALTAFNQALENSPNYISAQQGKGISLYNLGKYNQAIEIFEQIVQLSNLAPKQKIMSWLYQGVIYCQLKQPATAKEAFATVLKFTSDPQSQKIAQAECGIR
ncbi:tetratricopeptide repeat protein [Pleurocapsa sp. FMAR1]|uniref:tetratricopeptide repeat protein n=1 Tax=Pleurocapsa sp. FMAR1 TaxID=3040204 RepID=UPI0029C7F66A|nr:tetratricopeptide repeat protein [Pleurocapsa sp. FMAR1]